MTEVALLQKRIVDGERGADFTAYISTNNYDPNQGMDDLTLCGHGYWNSTNDEGESIFHKKYATHVLFMNL